MLCFDMRFSSLCILTHQAELQGKRFLCRTAASFVSARIGIVSKPPIRPKDLGLKRTLAGGLIVVGSYVPKTTKQVCPVTLQDSLIHAYLICMFFHIW
jgi:hypothetical protein